MSYAAFDEDPWADAEALEAERFDADLQMAEMTAVGNAMRTARRSAGSARTDPRWATGCRSATRNRLA